MDALITSVGIPLASWLLMLVVGLELTTPDFRRVLQWPGLVVTATLGQLILLPLLAAIMILVFTPPFPVAAGMVLVAACPGGAISNFYVYLARANNALSVTLTAMSTALSLVTLPVIAWAGFTYLLDAGTLAETPTGRIVQQLLIMLVMPVTLGMLVRHRFSNLVHRWHPLLRKLSIVALVVLVILILISQKDNLGVQVLGIVPFALGFSVVSMAAGWFLGRLMHAALPDRFAIMIEFGVRNLAITAVIGMMILGRLDVVLFAVVFFLTQVPVAILLIGGFHKLGIQNTQGLSRPTDT